MAQTTPHIQSGEYKLVSQVKKGDVVSCPPPGTTWAQGWEFGKYDRVWLAVRAVEKYYEKYYDGTKELRYRLWGTVGAATPGHGNDTYICPNGQYVRCKGD